MGAVLLTMALAAVISISITGADVDDVETRSNGGPEDNSYMDLASYNGSTECGICHLMTHDSWMESLHPKKMRLPDEESIVADWSTDPFLDIGGGVEVTIQLSMNESGYWVDLDGSGTDVYRVDYVLGGGAWKQMYLTTIGNSSYILPNQWNNETDRWVANDATDWYEIPSGNPTEPEKSQSWDRRCAGCHATGVEVEYNAESEEWIASWEELGIGCEACHGPGSLHIVPPDGVDKRNDYIWSTVDSAVCGNCHNRGVSVGKLGGTALDYPLSGDGKIIRPGDNHGVFFYPQGEYYPDDETSKSHRQQYPDYIGHQHSKSLATILESDRGAELCLKCHSTDYRLAPDDQKPSLSTAEFSIECVACHDPHGTGYGHMLRIPQDEVCTQCHQTFETPPGETVHHPQAEMLEGIIAITEITGEPWMGGVYICTDCHMPKVASNAVEQDIASHRFYFISPAKSIQNGQPNSCTTNCHGPTTPGSIMTDQEMLQLIDGWKAQTTGLLAAANANLSKAKDALDAAEGYAFPFVVYNASRQVYNQAILARDYVAEDGTMVHNHDFAEELLTFASEKANEVVAELAPGIIVGELVDDHGKGVSGAEIKWNGTVRATTADDGSFEIRIAPGEYTFEVYEGTKKTHEFTAESPTGGGTEDLGKVSYEGEEGISLWVVIVLVLVVVLLIGIAALMLPRRKS
jgi:predicted CXXCH cytochrome family protein